MPTTDLLGSAEVARRLGTSQRTVQRLVASGALEPALTAPGGFAGIHLFDPADVERIKAQREAAA